MNHRSSTRMCRLQLYYITQQQNTGKLHKTESSERSNAHATNCTCVYVCEYAHARINTHARIVCIHKHIARKCNIYTYAYVYMFDAMNTRTHIHRVYIYIYIYVYTYMYMYICIYIYVYKYIYIYIYCAGYVYVGMY